MTMPDARNQDINCYALLGVPRGSSAREIQRAFRKLSLKNHPDRGGSNEAQARINHAYEILSDPARRRRHDAALSAMAENSPVKRYRSGQAEEWEKSFHRQKVKKNIKDRVREEVIKRSEEIRSGYGRRVDAEFALAGRVFKRTRARFVISAAGACVFMAAGFVNPLLWAGAAAAGYMLWRNARYGSGDEVLFILHPEWRHILKQRARKKVTLETESMRAHLEVISETLDRFLIALRRTSGIRDDEPTVLKRILTHFFMLGYGPVSHDAEDRVVVVKSGDEKIAVRYRHRTGTPANAAFIKKLRYYMVENNIRRGFLYASPGLSRNAAKLVENHGIVHYTARDLNAWIEGTATGHYPGPPGDLIRQIDSFMDFMQKI